MEILNFFAQDAQGNIMPSAECYLYAPGTTNLVSGLVDINGMPISNPFQASNIGQVQFGAPNGVYDLRMKKGVRDTTIRIQCADLLQALNETASFLGARATAPTTRADGTPLQLADRYLNTTDQIEYIYKSSGWVANNLDGQILSTTQGASLVGALMKDGSPGTVQQAINASDSGLRQDLSAPSGSSMVGFVQPESGSSLRDVADKLEEVVSVLDRGAIEGGVIDCTDAFLSLPDGGYVPKGSYFVDTLLVDLNKFKGPGEIHSHNGQVISLSNDPIGSPYIQRRIMAPVFGGAGGVPAIYPGATNAPQGLCRFKHPVTKEDWFFISQYISGLSWSALEYSRDTSWRFRDDGQPQNVAEISPLMNKTHAHLSAIYENDQIWMYQSFKPPADAIDNTKETGCGWSKYPWRGAASSDAELVNYRVWGRPGSGHRYQNFGKACVQVSQDGRYVIMVGINYGDEFGSVGGRTLFIYDRLEVESSADPLSCEPVYASKPLLGLAIDSDTAYQGETTDGRFVYVVWGSAAVFGRRGVSIYTLTGDHLRDIHLDGSLSKYTYQELRNGHPTLGICTASEPEGISIHGDEIYIQFSDNWAAIGDVVSRNGLNYVCKATTTADPETDSVRWTVTDLPATSGVWVANKTPPYAPGPTTQRDKTIYGMAPPKGLAGEEPLVSIYCYPRSPAQVAFNAGNLMDMSIAKGGYFRMSVYNPITDGSRPAVEYASQSAWRIRDTRSGANYSARLDLAMDSREAGNRLSTISQVGDGGAGPNIQMYDVQSPGNPGNLYLGTADVVGSELRLFNRGETRLNVGYDEIVAYRPFRYLTTNVYPLMTASRVATTVYLQTAPVVASDARLKTPVRDMSDAEIAVGRRLALEPGFYKWLSSIDEKGEQDARWHSGMTVQRAIEIFEDEGIDPFAYGAVCHDVWGDEFETVDAVRLPTGEYEIWYDKLGNEVSREPITEEWAPAAQRQTQWAGDKFSFRENEMVWLAIKALAFDQARINARLDALESK